MAAFKPFARSATSIIEAIRNNTSIDYDPKVDRAITPDAEENDPRNSLAIQFSVGSGRGSSLVKLAGSEVEGVVAAFEDFDPESPEESNLSTAEIVRKTLSRTETDDGVFVTFKTSLAKNARTHHIPEDDWTKFVHLMRELDGAVDPTLEHYRNVTKELASRPPKAPAAPAPDGTVKRGPGRPRKVQPEAAPSATATDKS